MKVSQLFAATTVLYSVSFLSAQELQPPTDGPGIDMQGAAGDAAPNSEEEEKTEIEIFRRANFVLTKIRQNTRQLDPFGMLMDPTNTSSDFDLSEQYSEIDDVPVLNQSSLQNALENLPISGIYPERRVVVMGARSLKQGDQFGMKLDDLTIRLRFEGIKQTKIFFKDMDTQEIATVDFNPLPAEFEPITNSSSPALGQGIVPMSELFIVN